MLQSFCTLQTLHAPSVSCWWFSINISKLLRNLQSEEKKGVNNILEKSLQFWMKASAQLKRDLIFVCFCDNLGFCNEAQQVGRFCTEFKIKCSTVQKSIFLSNGALYKVVTFINTTAKCLYWKSFNFERGGTRCACQLKVHLQKTIHSKNTCVCNNPRKVSIIVFRETCKMKWNTEIFASVSQSNSRIVMVYLLTLQDIWTFCSCSREAVQLRFQTFADMGAEYHLQF